LPERLGCWLFSLEPFRRYNPSRHETETLVLLPHLDIRAPLEGVTRVNQLSLWSKVVFVDWQGVLSRDPFWMSIRENASHPLRAQLEANLADVFSREGGKADDWMKGLLTSQDIIAGMDIKLDRRFREDFLPRRLNSDCARMRINVELVGVLRGIRSQALVVLATDNMDCFARTFDRLRRRARRPTSESKTFADWALIYDDIICSSDVGALKAEDPVAFFGSWLSDHGFSFRDAALIDDRADNCSAFASQGGRPVQWKMGSSDISEVIEALDRLLAEPRSSHSDGDNRQLASLKG
jgi:hypothetical protein